MELQNYNDFISFFKRNKNLSLKKFTKMGREFSKIFDEILSRAKLHKNRTESQAVTLILYLRALKYLFTIHGLTLEGHLEEARALKRSVLEIILLGFLVENSQPVFELWEECFRERLKHTDNDGLVDIPKLRNEKYEIGKIIKSNGDVLRKNPVIASLIRRRGEFSTYFSHENIYNIVSRIENTSSEGLGKLEVYIGQSAKSKNDRLYKDLKQNMEVLKIIDELIK